jgi:phosphatidylglycerol:prolipoprotein diacylglycerol transferase
VIPYIQIPVTYVGPIPLDPWGILVTLGFVFGLEMARARGISRGLDVRDVVDGIVFTVLSGFVGGHLVHVLAYHPEQLAESGEFYGLRVPGPFYNLLRIWAGFSSFGGFIGAVVGINVFYRLVRRRPFWPHADCIMYGFPFGWVFGRLGCAIVHDHIGRKTDFFLAVNFEQKFAGMGVRHDLGLYEALYTVGIALVFYACRTRAWKPGTMAVVWCFMYAPVRFLLDFLRNTDLKSADVRWSGLTPAQWGCLVMLGAGVALFSWLRRQPGPTGPWAGDGVPQVGEGRGDAEAPTHPEGAPRAGS